MDHQFTKCWDTLLHQARKKAVDVLISIETVEKVQLLLFIEIHI